MTKNDGGPAFPTLWQGELLDQGSGNIIQQAGYVDGGMSLRDWFAGQALVGLGSKYFEMGQPEDRARWAYEQADLMLAEREKGNG